MPNQSSEKTIPTNDASTDVDASADADASTDADASADAVASADAEPVDELANQVTVATAKPKYRWVQLRTFFGLHLDVFFNMWRGQYNLFTFHVF